MSEILFEFSIYFYYIRQNERFYEYGPYFSYDFHKIRMYFIFCFC